MPDAIPLSIPTNCSTWNFPSFAWNISKKMHWIKDLFQRFKNDKNVFPAAGAPIFLTKSQVKSLTLLSLKN